ncbi:MAG TPA: GntR family transcriptional regulator [Roseiflexaceae bacterium]|nr:GntR family transcriptional regulator [Roseiflexaceae bacterium]
MIAQVLREAILRGLYDAGQVLRQDQIATTLQVSKIPVREALRRLEAEGLVVFHANRGASVAPLSPTEAQEIAEIRIALETLALRLALPNLTARHQRRARAVLDDLDTEQDSAQWGALNRDFHQILYMPAVRPQLLGLIATQHRRFDRYMRVVLATMRHHQQSQAEHRALLGACEQRDISAATNILEQHIAEAARLLVGQLPS